MSKLSEQTQAFVGNTVRHENKTLVILCQIFVILYVVMLLFSCVSFIYVAFYG